LKGSVTGETKPLLFTEASILRIACLQEEDTKEKMLLHQIAINCMYWSLHGGATREEWNLTF
jgi:hypothetical protein